jgi:hypothetical protein
LISKTLFNVRECGCSWIFKNLSYWIFNDVNLTMLTTKQYNDFDQESIIHKAVKLDQKENTRLSQYTYTQSSLVLLQYML